VIEWGVLFRDGSVRHPWNGHTARKRAVEELIRLRTEYAPDPFELVYREDPQSPWMKDTTVGWMGWGRMGLDDGGMPAHLPMGVTAFGEGPEDDSAAHHYRCWCPDPECPLTKALLNAWAAGRRTVV
jgi:hypothetical protein